MVLGVGDTGGNGGWNSCWTRWFAKRYGVQVQQQRAVVEVPTFDSTTGGGGSTTYSTLQH